MKKKTSVNNMNSQSSDSYPRLSKSQKRKQKLMLKKQKKDEINVDEDALQVKDKVKFGEVVNAPPTLNIRPKKANKESTNRPGKKNLLLNQILKSQKNSTKRNVSGKTVINKSGKWKDLPIGERRKLEKERSEVIAAYRLLKSKNSSVV